MKSPGSKVNLMRAITCLAVVASLTAIDTSAWGFTVGRIRFGPIPIPGDANHEEITLSALSDIKATYSGIELAFSTAAKNIIKDANAITDSESMSVDEVHFDNESFALANERLYVLRMAIVAKAKKRKYLEAQKNLGAALHTVQDFYAHTTWVEKGFPGTADLGVSLYTDFQKSIGATCTEGATQTINSKKTGIILNSALTGEYFDTLDNPIVWANDDGKCIHGLPNVANAKALGAGINKDTSVRDFFPAARSKAIEATKRYVQLILSDLSGHEAAVRGLFGLEAHITLVATGRVTDVQDRTGGLGSILSRGVVVGDIFTITVTYPIGLRDDYPNDYTYGWYPDRFGGESSFSMKIGDNSTLTLPAAPFDSFNVLVHNRSSGGFNGYTFRAQTNCQNCNYVIPGLQLNCPTPVCVNYSDTLPIQAPVLELFGEDYNDRLGTLFVRDKIGRVGSVWMRVESISKR